MKNKRPNNNTFSLVCQKNYCKINVVVIWKQYQVLYSLVQIRIVYVILNENVIMKKKKLLSLK